MILSVEKLEQKCSPEKFDFKTTEEIEPFDQGIIGQKRAVEAANLGLKVQQEGYNIFMAGITGTGKTTYARKIARDMAQEKEIPSDLCYVYNFNDRSSPEALILPAGMGEELCEDMDDLINELKEEIPRAFESEEHEKRKSSIMSEFQEESNKLLEELEKDIRKDGFILQNTGQRSMPTPVPIDKDGNPITKEKYQELSAERKQEIKEKNLEIQEKIENLRRVIRNLRLETQEQLERLDKKYARKILKPMFINLKEKYDCCRPVIKYLGEVENDIIDNIDKFNDKKQDKNNIIMAIQQGDGESFFKRYRVNLLVNNREAEGAPVVVESNPNYYNLFGKIEGKSQFGTITTDFTMIKEGSIHKANGGYLIINALDLLRKPFSWETLKRTLLNQKIVVENIGEQYRTIPITTLKPEAIDINVKVILIGNPYIYQLLYNYDEEFKKLFKVKADFDVEMKRNNENIKKFAAFVSSICRREEIRHFTDGAVARLIEYSSRLAGKKEKMSTRFNQILEVVYEANVWADSNDHNYIEAEDVVRAVREKDYRSNLIEEKIQEMINKGHILIDIEGEEVGQINGLSVYQTGEYSF
ncbi:MAG: AAA family ATPase, partial [Halanaerobiaceae bacterium]